LLEQFFAMLRAHVIETQENQPRLVGQTAGARAKEKVYLAGLLTFKLLPAAGVVMHTAGWCIHKTKTVKSLWSFDNTTELRFRKVLLNRVK
jgi:hypothetical protein